MAVDLSSSGSALSVAGMPIAFATAFVFILFKPRRRGRTRLRTVLRVLLNRHVWLHPSTLLDMQYVIVGAFGFSLLFGYTLLSGLGVGAVVCEGLTGVFGDPAEPAELPFFAKVLVIAGLHLAFEFAYWLDHFLSHKIPFLWEFHKVHHSATVLTPFANWRVHPVDTIVYMNILALVVGSATGLVQYFAGVEFALTATAISGVVYAVYMAVWGHLQHSQFWLSCTGLAGRLVLSPAHHQIHHSRNPIHFDKNFGAGLAIWDWLFGTLHVPQRHNERLRYGTHGDAHLKRFIPSVLYPFLHAAKRLAAPFCKRNTTPERKPVLHTETHPVPVANGVLAGK